MRETESKEGKDRRNTARGGHRGTKADAWIGPQGCEGRGGPRNALRFVRGSIRFQLVARQVATDSAVEKLTSSRTTQVSDSPTLQKTKETKQECIQDEVLSFQRLMAMAMAMRTLMTR
jgi:hypothetical protein